MITVVQRVHSASVDVAGDRITEIGLGFLVLLGVLKGDDARDAELLARKIAALRVFADADGKMNLDLAQVQGAVLAVSQFTLAASIRKGHRPGFDRAMPPGEAEPLFQVFVDVLRSSGIEVQCGRFAAEMDVSLVNSGPVTILYDSKNLV